MPQTMGTSASSELSRRVLTAHVFTEVAPRRENHSIKWLVAELLGTPKYNRDPTVVVVTDEEGKEQGRSSYGPVSTELRRMVEDAFPLT